MSAIKKILSYFCLSVMLLFTACDKDEDTVEPISQEKWESVIATVSISGYTVYEVSTQPELETMGLYMIVDLNEDGSALVTKLGDPIDGTWKQEEDKITITTEDDVDVFVKSGNYWVFEENSTEMGITTKTTIKFMKI